MSHSAACPQAPRASDRSTALWLPSPLRLETSRAAELDGNCGAWRQSRFAGLAQPDSGALQKLDWRILMYDLIFVGIVVAFFLISGLYVCFCEKL